MAKILVVLADQDTKHEAIRLCKRLGKVKQATAEFIILKTKIKARDVIEFLKVQTPLVDAVERIH